MMPYSPKCVTIWSSLCCC